MGYLIRSLLWSLTPVRLVIVSKFSWPHPTGQIRHMSFSCYSFKKLEISKKFNEILKTRKQNPYNICLFVMTPSFFFFLSREKEGGRQQASSVILHSALSSATWREYCPAAECLHCIFLENEFPLFGQRPLAAEGSHPDFHLCHGSKLQTL